MSTKKLCIGTSGWAYTTWKPEFYPAKTPSTKFLSYYATRLNGVEVNYTFRARPAVRTLQNWCEATPETFTFVVKAHQRITHIKRLKDVETDVAGFCESLRPLSEAGKLGPILFQLPPHLKADVDRLRRFLQCVPKGMRAAMEFRNESWFADGVLNLLREYDAALCVAESDDLEVPDVNTASFAYYRFRKSDYTEAALHEIENRLTQSMRQGDVYAFFKHEETAEGALNARRVRYDLEQPR